MSARSRQANGAVGLKYGTAGSMRRIVCIRERQVVWGGCPGGPPASPLTQQNWDRSRII